MGTVNFVFHTMHGDVHVNGQLYFQNMVGKDNRQTGIIKNRKIDL